jgi:hypothetical protein
MRHVVNRSRKVMFAGLVAAALTLGLGETTTAFATTPAPPADGTAQTNPTFNLAVNSVTGQRVVDIDAVPTFDANRMTYYQYELYYHVTVIYSSTNRPYGFCFGYHGSELVEYNCVDGTSSSFPVVPIPDGTPIASFQLDNYALGLPIGTVTAQLVHAPDYSYWMYGVMGALAQNGYGGPWPTVDGPVAPAPPVTAIPTPPVVTKPVAHHIVASRAPVVVGLIRPGHSVHVMAMTWRDSVTNQLLHPRVTCQWYRDGQAIPHATQCTAFKIPTTHYVGHRLKVKVSASYAGRVAYVRVTSQTTKVR